MMTDEIYLFCLAFDFYSVKHHIPIIDMARYYTSILYSDKADIFPSWLLKRIYNHNKEEAFRQEQENIEYCVQQLKNNTKRNAYIKKTR